MSKPILVNGDVTNFDVPPKGRSRELHRSFTPYEVVVTINSEGVISLTEYEESGAGKITQKTRVIWKTPVKSTRYIKNPHIIHMLESTENGEKYMCIWAVDPTPEKSTWDETKVTCQNCLRGLKKKTQPQTTDTK